jgi:hypothetical protein
MAGSRAWRKTSSRSYGFGRLPGYVQFIVWFLHTATVDDLALVADASSNYA